jgi:hypothetical protein
MKTMNLIISLITVFSFFSCNQEVEKEIYLIPSTFKGKVNVIFSQANGKPIKYENNARVYEIPEDGILLTQFKEQEGFVKREYFYVDKDNNKKPLKIIIDIEDETSTEISVFRDGTIGVYGNSNDENSLTYQEFYITDKGSFESYFSNDSINDFTKRLQLKTGYKY